MSKNPPRNTLMLGEWAAEKIAAGVGSWPFIIAQSTLLCLWATLNATGGLYHWDPYPFVFLNLLMSLQAAYTAPMIMMSQNRQADKDRRILHENHALNNRTHELVRHVLTRLDSLDAQVDDLNTRVRLIQIAIDADEEMPKRPGLPPH